MKQDSQALHFHFSSADYQVLLPYQHHLTERPFPAVVVASLQAQLNSSQTNAKLVSQLHFNSESSIDPTRVVGVEWVPHANGDLFVAAHSSGSVYTYSKVTI